GVGESLEPRDALHGHIAAVDHVEVDAGPDGGAALPRLFDRLLDDLDDAVAPHGLQREHGQIVLLRELPVLQPEVAIGADPRHVAGLDRSRVEDAARCGASPDATPHGIPLAEIELTRELKVPGTPA